LCSGGIGFADLVLALQAGEVSWGMAVSDDAMEPRVWLVLTFGEDRQYAGNAGYDDDPSSWYSYDSFVPNHRQVAIGDFFIVCDKASALGVARIKSLEEEPSTRVMLRCPVCHTTGIKKRRTKYPAYRCNDGHEFDEPERETAPCTKFTARFDETFQPFTEPLGRDFLKQGCPRYSDQLSMQEFDWSRMDAVFRKAHPEAARLIGGINSSYYIADAAADDSNGLAEYIPTEGDERERLLRQIRARRGQQGFRDELRKRYGDKCLVSGCPVLHVLEAAHIRPYRGEADNHAENGLLLRADLHTLFDFDLMGVEPSTLIVHFHPEVRVGEYQKLHGRTLACSTRKPSAPAIASRWKAFKERGGF